MIPQAVRPKVVLQPDTEEGNRLGFSKERWITAQVTEEATGYGLSAAPFKEDNKDVEPHHI